LKDEFKLKSIKGCLVEMHYECEDGNVLLP
jgi:hypothetical protein